MAGDAGGSNDGVGGANASLVNGSGSGALTGVAASPSAATVAVIVGALAVSVDSGLTSAD
jgi:hypothetical protein